jgi:cyanophycinase
MAVVLATVLLAISAAEQEFAQTLLAQQPSQRRVDIARPISGSLVIAGGGTLPPEIVQRFLELGGGEKTRLVVVTTASVFAGTEEMDARMSHWREKPLASFHVLHTRSRDEANDPNFYRPLDDATAVWFVGGNQNWVTDAYLGTRTEQKFHEVIQRGGVIGGTSAGAAIMSRVMISGVDHSEGRQVALLRTGFGFAPGLIVDQHFRKRNRQDRLIDALNRWPGHVGMGIDEGTALVIRGNTAEVIGVSDVTIAFGPAHDRPIKTASLQAGKSADLTVLSRVAMARVSNRASARPEVKNGTLLLVGDGTAPEEARRKFLDAAGGVDAPILVVSSVPELADNDHEICRWLRSGGASNVKALAVRGRIDVESPAFLSQLTQARGIWLGSGPIRKLVDTYVDTPAQALLKEVLERGGVIAGSAEGAMVQSAALPVTAQSDELDVTAEAYERGFGLLPGVALARRHEEQSPSHDLAELKSKYPELIGVELNDSTALVVRGTRMEVLGKNAVTVLDRRPQDADDHPETCRIHPGESYDLCERIRVPMTAKATGDQ